MIKAATFKEPAYFFKGVRSEMQLRKIDKEIQEYEKAAKEINDLLAALKQERRKCVKFRLSCLM